MEKFSLDLVEIKRKNLLACHYRVKVNISLKKSRYKKTFYAPYNSDLRESLTTILEIICKKLSNKI